MKSREIHLLVSFFFLTLISTGTSAAPTSPVPSSFQDASSSASVDLSTGDFSLPLNVMTVPGRGGMDFPVTLRYTAGIPLEQFASSVGLGWSLDVGSVSRQVIGIPDEYYPSGGDTVRTEQFIKCSGDPWLKFGYLLVHFNKFVTSIAPSVMTMLITGSSAKGRAVFSLNIDPLPDHADTYGRSIPCDELVVNGNGNEGGATGYFYSNNPNYFNGSDNVTPDIFFVTGSDVAGRILYAQEDSFVFSKSKGYLQIGSSERFAEEVLMSKSGGTINAFTVTTVDGTRYEYGGNGGTVSVFKPLGEAHALMSRSENSHDSSEFYEMRFLKDFNTEWMLSSITSPDGSNHISFFYDEWEPLFRVKYPYDGSWNVLDNNNWHAKSELFTQVKVLSRIETDTHTAFLDYDDARFDGFSSDFSAQAPRLRSIRLYSNNDLSNELKSVNLIHETNLLAVGSLDVQQDGKGRLALERIEEHGSDGTKLQTTIFEYAQDAAPGQYSNPRYEKYKSDRWGYYCADCSAYDDNPQGASRIDPTVWSLSKITWPTGGDTSIFYESDRYNRVNNFYPDQFLFGNNFANRDDAHYGGGARVSLMATCDGLGNCFHTRYFYNVHPFDADEDDGYDDVYSGGETSGVASLEPRSRTRFAGEDRLSFGGGYTPAQVRYSRVTTVTSDHFLEVEPIAPYGYTVNDFTTSIDFPSTGKIYVRSRYNCENYPLSIGGNPASKPTLFFGPPNVDVEAFGAGQNVGVQCTTDSDGYCQLRWKNNNGNDLASGTYWLIPMYGSCSDSDNHDAHLKVTYYSGDGGYTCFDGNADGNCDAMELPEGQRFGGRFDSTDLHGLPIRTTTYDARGGVVSVTENNYDHSVLMGKVIGRNEIAKQYSRLSRTMEIESAVRGVGSKTSYDYVDDGVNGFMRSTTVEPGGFNERVVTNEYEWETNDLLADANRFSEVKSSQVTSNGQLVASSRNVYSDFSGVQRPKEFHESKTANSEVVSFTDSYDSYGNPTLQRDENGKQTLLYFGNNDQCSNGGGQWAHALITCTEDAVGLATTYKYNSKGMLERMTAPDGSRTTYNYDEFGRLRTVLKPGDSTPSTTFDYYIAGEALSGSNLNRITERERISGELWKETRSYFDGLGRLIRTEVENGNSDLISETAYDAYSRIVQSSVPHTASLPPVYWRKEFADSPEGILEADYPAGSQPSWEVVQSAVWADLSRSSGYGETGFMITSDGFYDVYCSISGAEDGDIASAQLEDLTITSSELWNNYVGRVSMHTCSYGFYAPQVTDSRRTVFLKAGHSYRASVYADGVTARIVVSNRQKNKHFQVFADSFQNNAETPGISVSSDTGGNLYMSYLDSLGRVYEERDPTGGVTWYERDSAGRPTTVFAPNGLISVNVYDLLGRATDVSSPDAGSLHHAYDDAGNEVTKTVNGGEKIFNYEYDAINRLRKVSFGGVPDRYYTFDSSASPYHKGKLFASSNKVTAHWFEYDSRAYVSRETQFFHGSCKRTDTGEVFSYGCPDINMDGLVDSSDVTEMGQTCSNTPASYAGSYYHPMLDFDRDGSVTASECTRFQSNNGKPFSSVGFRLTYTYNNAGLLEIATYPGGTQIKYLYDSLGRLDEILRKPLNGAFARLAKYAYDGYNRQSRITFGHDAWQSFDYDNRFLLESDSFYAKNGDPLWQETYAYTPGGNLDSLHRTDLGKGAAFSYDALDRLTAIWAYDGYYGFPQGMMGYSYDSVGNRMTEEDSDEPPRTYSYYSGTNRLQRAGDAGTGNGCLYSYDSQGHVISMTNCVGGSSYDRQLDYDYEGNLKRIRYANGNCEQYYYDESGNRVKKVVKTASQALATYYAFSGGNVIQTLSDVPVSGISCS
ncbi:hypothetical protein KJ765_03065 [Candidatus Micrarchaeota archaeon]|nr:hypothetical protein [Candidatus Micrarchaeota archaeon]